MVRKEPWERQEQRARLDQLALPERLERRESLVYRVRLAPKDRLEPWPLRPITASIMGPGTKRVRARLKSRAPPIAIRLT